MKIRSRHLITLPAPAIIMLMLGFVLNQANARELAEKIYTCADYLGTMPVSQGQALTFPIDILSWNIQKTNTPGWLEDLANLSAHSQLSFIQEASLQSKLAEVRPQSPLYQSFSQGYINSKQNTGVMTLSTHAPTMQCNFSRIEPWLGIPKAATVTEHALADRNERLLAINIHAVNFTLGVEDLQQQLQPLASLLSKHEGPAVLAGDFNTWSEPRQQLVDDILAGYDLQPVLFEPDLRTRAFGRPLDHIYIRGLRASYAEVFPVTSSDHNALRARLELKD